MPADLHYLGLDEVAKRLKARQLSSIEATRALLERIDRLDPRLKSYATLTPDHVLTEAAARDAETAAGQATERMSLPVMALLLGFLVFFAYPAVSQVLNGL